MYFRKKYRSISERSDQGAPLAGLLKSKMAFSLHLEALAFSVITDDHEELLYCQMRGFAMACGNENEKYSLTMSVLELQVIFIRKEEIKIIFIDF